MARSSRGLDGAAAISGRLEKEPGPMTIDKSLKIRAGAIRNRNVLTRAERIAKLKAADRWSDDSDVLGLPKVRVQKLSLKKKKKVKKEEEETKGK
jgi:small basic protein (TIGR04137 family)